jgi:type I restriction enzyme S subunit
MIVRLSDVVNRVNNNIDRFNTPIKYYLGKGHGECGEIAITEHGNLKEDVGMLGFKFHFAFQPGDSLFFSRSFALRKAGMATYEGICSDSTYILRSKDNNVLLSEYLPAVIQSDDFWEYCDTHHTGGVNFLINWSTLADYEFDLPSLAEQKVLAEKLWAAYEVKQSYLKMIEATQEMVKSQFIEMTGDPRTNPKGWPIKTLPELATYSIGLTYKPENISEDGTIVLRSGNIQNSKIDLADVVRVNCPIKESIYVQKNDILMCSRNGSASLVGKVAQIKDISEPMTYGAFMTVIRSEYSDYLYLYFQSNDFREQVSTGKSSTMNQITQNMLDKISLPLPDDETRKKLSIILHQADKSGFELRKSIDAIDKVIKSLINENL